MPKPAPDPVWYKWRGDEYVGYDWRHEANLQKQGLGHLFRSNKKWRKNMYKPGPGRASGSHVRCGWRWVCSMPAEGEDRVLPAAAGLHRPAVKPEIGEAVQ